jgi:hypothetical protein
MANVLTVPNSGIISFDSRAYSDLTVPPLSTSARIGYDGGGGVNITSYTTATTALDRFSVDGTQGRLFSVTDALTGTLFSVNNITGLPILEVTDDDTVIAGQFNTNAFVLSGTRLGLGTRPLGTNRLSVSGDSTFVGNLSVTGLIQGDFGFIQQGGNTVTVPLSVGTNGGQSLILETNGANRVTILSSGQVGINTPNFTLSANSTTYLTVRGSISADNTAKAWVNFNGSTTPPTIRSSFNVSSVARLGTGYFVIYLIRDMPNSDYCAVATSGNLNAATNSESTATTTRGPDNFAVYTRVASTAAGSNRADISVAVFAA